MAHGSRLFDDMARVANGALGTLSGLRQDIETMVRERIARVLDEMDLVSRDEFAAAEGLARKAREESEGLRAENAALREDLAKLTARVETLERKSAHNAAHETTAHPTPGPAPEHPARRPGPQRPLRRDLPPRRRR